MPYLSSAAVAKSASRSACSMRICERLELRLGRPDGGDRRLLGLPALLHPAGLLLEVGQLLLERLEPRLRRVVGLLAQRLALDLELDAPALELVELDRHRVDLHAQPRRRLVDEVDGLVRQEALGDVAVRQGRRGDERRVGDADAVVDLVALAQAAQDARSSPRRSAGRRGPAGSAARARRPSRCACGTRRASSRRSCGARRGRASA